MIKINLIGDKLLSNEREAFSLNDKSAFGEKKNSKVEFSSLEALFLVQQKKAHALSKKRAVSFEQLLKKVKKTDKKIETKLIVYSDLRNRGYIVKSALKFGAEFRAYDKGVKPGSDHAKWIVYTAKEHDTLNWHDFAAKNRVAHSTKKNLLLAIVDDESDVSYYEVSWLKP